MMAAGTWSLFGRQFSFTHKRLHVCGVQVLLRWSLQKGFVPLPKSISPARQAENAAVFGWQLSDADMAAIDSWEAGTSIMGAKLGR